jgi:hypothetical protein
MTIRKTKLNKINTHCSFKHNALQQSGEFTNFGFIMEEEHRNKGRDEKFI